MSTQQRAGAYDEEQSEHSEEGVDSEDSEDSEEEDALAVIGPRSGVPVGVKCEMPCDLPFVQPYEGGGFFFVRDCYDVYYLLVEKLLMTDRRCITLTGTRRIGKSVFYAYFLDRFRREHQGEGWVIVASSYNKAGEVQDITVFEEGKDPTIIRGATPEVLLKMAMRLAGVYLTDDGEWRGDGGSKKVLYLCDGPPKVTYTHAVVFTYPNDRWLSEVRDDECTYWMPPWTLNELRLAASVLDCPISDDEIEERFWNFGGVAQNCLQLSPACIQEAIAQLTRPIERISARDQIQDLLYGSTTSDICHRLLHYEPTGAGGMVMTEKLVSEMVCEKLSERVSTLTEGNMKEVDDFVFGLLDASSLRECTFKTIVHTALQRGLQLKAQLLSDEETLAKTAMFSILESPEIGVFDVDALSPSHLSSGPYHKPKLKMFESIDGLYFPITTAKPSKWRKPGTFMDTEDWRILFFQITASKQHHVRASEIVYVLQRLGLLGQVQENPLRAAIIYLEPAAVDKRNCTRQKIISDDGPPPLLIRDIAGIGPGVVKTLTEKYKVTTVDELVMMAGPFKQGKIKMNDSKHAADWR